MRISDNVVRKELTRRATNSLMDHFCILPTTSNSPTWLVVVTVVAQSVILLVCRELHCIPGLRLKKLSSFWLTDEKQKPQPTFIKAGRKSNNNKKVYLAQKGKGEKEGEKTTNKHVTHADNRDVHFLDNVLKTKRNTHTNRGRQSRHKRNTNSYTTGLNWAGRSLNLI